MTVAERRRGLTSPAHTSMITFCVKSNRELHYKRKYRLQDTALKFTYTSIAKNLLLYKNTSPAARTGSGAGVSQFYFPIGCFIFGTSVQDDGVPLKVSVIINNSKSW